MLGDSIESPGHLGSGVSFGARAFLRGGQDQNDLSHRPCWTRSRTLLRLGFLLAVNKCHFKQEAQMPGVVDSQGIYDLGRLLEGLDPCLNAFIPSWRTFCGADI